LSTADRRRFLLGCGALAGAMLVGSGDDARASVLAVREGPDEDAVPPCLVLVQLTGGNDGLSLLVPYGDDAYHRARPNIAIARTDVLDVDGRFGLPKTMPRLHRALSDGRLGVVHGVGYPDASRSHFKSFEVWHTGRRAGRSSGPGWIGRLAAARSSLDGARAERTVHVGRGAVPYSLHSSTHPPVAFAHPRFHRAVGGVALDDTPMDDAREAHDGSDEGLAGLRTLWRDAGASSARLRAAALGHRPRSEYPRDDFAGALSTAAALIAARIGVEVISVELGGFDTHIDQRRRHDRLMERLDGGLGAFLEELDRIEAARGTLVLVYSEFGRRVAENGARGTDHGAAGPVLLAGPKARGGLHGVPPSLTDLDGGDLRHTIDFRRVFAGAAHGTFGVPMAALFETGLGEPLRVTV
jgi:uncharacterized protein (DUF1501 family)